MAGVPANPAGEHTLAPHRHDTWYERVRARPLGGHEQGEISEYTGGGYRRTQVPGNFGADYGQEIEVDESGETQKGAGSIWGAESIRRPPHLSCTIFLKLKCRYLELEC